MLHADRDALACDLAEQYHLLDARSVPPGTLAVLACGLREGARIHRAMGGPALTEERALRLMTVDALHLLVWLHSADARHGRNRPASLLEQASTAGKPKQTQIFDSPEAFEAARARITAKAGRNDGEGTGPKGLALRRNPSPTRKE